MGGRKGTETASYRVSLTGPIWAKNVTTGVKPRSELVGVEVSQREKKKRKKEEKEKRKEKGEKRGEEKGMERQQ